jgi:hypothetical protein
VNGPLVRPDCLALLASEGMGESAIMSEAPATSMAESAPNPELLSSLGRLVRGLSALFWGLPIALIVCVQTGKGEWFEKFGILPPLGVTSLLFYGLGLLGHFQKQERVWLAALDRAKIFALINIGFSPFLYWWDRMPLHPFFNLMTELMMLSSLLFLFTLNPVLWRLAAMLPDETLRLETKLFTAINRYLILATLALLVAYFIMVRIHELPPLLINSLFLLEKTGVWLALLLVLLPVAMTMALVWKLKEVILASVFGPEH